MLQSQSHTMRQEGYLGAHLSLAELDRLTRLSLRRHTLWPMPCVHDEAAPTRAGLHAICGTTGAAPSSGAW